MQKNETVLTPIYRYVFNILEKNGKDSIDKSIRELEVFYNHWKDKMETVGLENDDYSVLKKCMDVLNAYKSLGDKAEEKWVAYKTEIEKVSCSNCYPCLHCKRYFWEELGEFLFNIRNEEKQRKKYIPLKMLPDKIARNLEPSVGTSELYRARAGKKSDEFWDKLIVLKGMSSSTPTMLNSIFDTDEFDGGGFFFNFHGYGVAIDPGYHFMRNLHHYGLSVLDIDAVIITHEHIDHNNDMRLLDDVHYSVYRYGKANAKGHQIKWYMDSVSYKLATILQESNSGFNEKANLLYCVNPEDGKDTAHDGTGDFSIQKEFKLTNDIKLEIFPTQHIVDDKGGYSKHTFGCRFVLEAEGKKTTVVYTSDTRYFQKLVSEVNDADILIANISGIYEDDYMKVKEKSTHLGYYGCYYLLRKCFEEYKKYPRFMLLSEFWSGKSDIRYDVSSQLSSELKEVNISEIYVLPAERGMTLDLDKQKIQCSQCGGYSDRIIVKKPSGLYEKINVVCDSCYY